MTIHIEPSREQIEKWIEEYVPNKDLYFLKEQDLHTFGNYLNHILVIPKDEFFQHESYNQIQIANSYEYWNISTEAKYIIVATSNWFKNLDINKQQQLSRIQVEMGRGLIIPLSSSSNKFSFQEENVVEDNDIKYLVLQYEMWSKLPFELKELLIKEYALQWDNWSCNEIPVNTPVHLKKYANTFPIDSGSNCLSSTLFAITEQEWIIYEWVHPQTFLQGLKNAQYYVADTDELKVGDVVTWENSDGIVQHASYYIGDHLCFNKNGQTFFNPWKIVAWSELKKEWKDHNIKIYRKKIQNRNHK